jgi:hypothetical protein
MNHRAHHKFGLSLFALALLFFLPIRGVGQAPTQRTAKAAAPIDLTGYWVAVITEDWRWRMVTPAKGDYQSVPITLQGQKMADAWDPAKDEAAGEQCKSYGPPGLMRAPTRLHITWQDDSTLKVESDYGTQTRVFHFGSWKTPGGAATLQGDSVASWETPSTGRQGAAPQPEEAPKFGDLKVVTNRLRPGYLRKNGIPFSANAVLTEYWDLFHERNGDQWIMVTMRVEDAEYLSRPWITALQFKKEPSGAKWEPTPCSARW